MDLTILTVIFFVLAVVVFVQLFNVLGRRTGSERPPFDPYAGNPKPETDVKNGENDNVVSLPRRADRAPEDFSDIDAVAAPGSALNDGLRAIRKTDHSFSPSSFCDGVRVAYEMIMTAFANGDRATLKDLLSKDVFDSFSGAIEERSQQGESVQFSFVGINTIEITSADVRANMAEVTLRIVSEVISATYDREGQQVDGDPQAVAEVHDLWTFARDVRSRDPNWRLVLTEDDA